MNCFSPIQSGQPCEWFRGIQFQRVVNPRGWGQESGHCRWQMIFPIQGPVFPSMDHARAWCRQNGIQDPQWYRGRSGNPGQW